MKLKLVFENYRNPKLFFKCKNLPDIDYLWLTKQITLGYASHCPHHN
jgi:hypothetical protein